MPTFDEVFNHKQLLKMEISKDSKGSEFHVLLSGMKLPAQLESKMAAEIQAVVTRNLAGYPSPDDPNGNDGPAGGGPQPHIGIGGPYVFIPPIRWRGIWLKALAKDFKINPAELDTQQIQLQKGFLNR